MNAVHTLCDIAENLDGQEVQVDCVRNISYKGVVVGSDTDPDDIHGRDAATVTVESQDGEHIRLVFRDNGSHTSQPVSLYVEAKDGRTYEINTIEQEGEES